MDALNRYCDEAMPIRTELNRWFEEKDGNLVFRRGKHKGRTLVEVAENEPDYLNWMLGADDMDGEVLEVVRSALSGPDQAPLAGSEPPL